MLAAGTNQRRRSTSTVAVMPHLLLLVVQLAALGPRATDDQQMRGSAGGYEATPGACNLTQHRLLRMTAGSWYHQRCHVSATFADIKVSPAAAASSLWCS
jgi:hypothetical protein